MLADQISKTDQMTQDESELLYLEYYLKSYKFTEEKFHEILANVTNQYESESSVDNLKEEINIKVAPAKEFNRASQKVLND